MGARVGVTQETVGVAPHAAERSQRLPPDLLLLLLLLLLLARAVMGVIRVLAVPVSGQFLSSH